MLCHFNCLISLFETTKLCLALVIVPQNVIWCAHKCTRKAEFCVLGWISGGVMMVCGAPRRWCIFIYFITFVLNHISCDVTPKAFQSAVLRSQKYQNLLCTGQAVTLTDKCRVTVNSVRFEVLLSCLHWRPSKWDQVCYWLSPDNAIVSVAH